MKAERLSPEQAAIVTAYTGILSGALVRFHEYAETLLGRGIYTHEFGDRHVWAQLKEASREDFLSICCMDKR